VIVVTNESTSDSPELRNQCVTVLRVVTQAMGVRYEARPVFELVTQIAGDMSCQKLSCLNWFVNHCQVQPWPSPGSS
jgi:hypothetical protein